MRTILVIASLLLTGCSHMANDAWSGQDKAQHFLASAMLSAAGNEYAQHQGYSRDRSAAIGLMFSVSLGASKELWDSRPAGSGWSWKDLLGMSPARPPATLYGSWLISKRYRRNPFPLRCNIRETRKAMAAITVTYQ